MRTYQQLRRVAPPVLLLAFGVLACSESPTEQGVPSGLKPAFAPGSNPGVNLDQWANGSPAPTGESWQNGNLNGNNSTYAERLAVPFRLAIEGLSAGNHFITINYDFTAGGHKAYDFLASIDATEPNALAQICAVGGGGVSSLCGTSTTGMPQSVPFDDEPFPGDPFLDPESNKTVNQAIALEALDRDLRIYGGTIVSIGPVEHDGLTTGNSTGQMLVTFNVPAGGTAVLLAWSGHLGYSVFWNNPGDPDGAGEVSGAPWHMRTLNLNDGGAANQDRSIQPSALVEVVADANISISTSGVNEIGTWHPMTGHVNIDDGDGFENAPAGTVVTFAIASGPGIIVGANGSTTPLNPATCATVGTTGSCTVYLYSTTTGLTTVNASTSVQVSGQTVARSTDGVAPNSGPLTKQWVDAQIDLSPLTATNPLADNHIVTATVQKDDGLAAGAPGGDGVTGFGPAPNGTLVTFSLLNNTANAVFVGNVSTCTTTAGTCSITLDPANAGGVDIHATTTFSINGESVTRATGTGGLNSANAHKDWQNAAVTIVKTGDALSKIGDQVTYTFTITNTGSIALTLVSLVDDKLGNLADGEAPAACSPLAAGAVCNFNVNHTVPAGASDPYVNTVNVTYSSGVGNATSSDNHSTNLFQPAVTVVKTGPATGAVGQSITYSFTITNTGSADSPNLILDSVNDNVLGDLADEAPAACDALAPAASCNFTASRTILAGDPDPLVNTVTVHYHPQGFPNDIADTDDHSVDIVSSAVVIDKSGDALSKVGDPVTYTFKITNTNGIAINLTSVVDDLLGSLTAAATTAGCATLAPAASCSFSASRTVQAGDPDPLVNTVVATYSFTTGGGTVTITDSDSHSTNLFQPAVVVTKTSATTLAVVGQNVTYSFTVTNTGSADSPNLILDTFTDNVLGDLADDAPAACDALAPAASCNFTASRVILAGDADPLTNTATVHYHPLGFPNDITDTDDHTVDIAHPSFTVTKACTNAPVALGVATAWSITVTNTGDVTIALNVSDAQINLGGGAGVNVSLAAGASQTFTGSGATSNTAGATISNTATAVGTLGGTTFNQTKSASATCLYQTPGATLLIIDEDGIDNGLHFNESGGLIVPAGPQFFSDVGVNDDKPTHTMRDVLRYFAANITRTITVKTGQTGDEAWFAPNCIPQKWLGSGNSNQCLTGANRNTAISNYFFSGSVPPQDKLDKIPAVMPLRALGLNSLVGRDVCAVVYDSDISINYNSNRFPFTDGNLQGETLGIVAFHVNSTTTLEGFSTTTLPQVQITILNTNVCGTFQLFNAPVPKSSSEPPDQFAPGSPVGYRALLTLANQPLFY